ncbi:MAG: esterase/lipase family protein [Pirellula sp.]
MNLLGTCRIICKLLSVLISLCLTGCRICDRSCSKSGLFLRQSSETHVLWPTEGSPTKRAEHFLELANSLSDADDARSVDYYFNAATLSWALLSDRAEFATPHHPSWDVYQTSLQGLVTNAVRFGRFDGCGNLNIYQPHGPILVPVTSSSLDWPIEQLRQFQIPLDPEQRKLKRYFKKSGLGVPIVAFRIKPAGHEVDPLERYLPEQHPLASTLILRSADSSSLVDHSEHSSEESNQFVIELVDPLKVNAIEIQSQPIPIAKDLSAPLDYQLRNRPTNPFLGFVAPGTGSQNDGLRWVDPYQPGKIPVVFIHGLVSEPTTWLDMLNELRTIPWFNDRYQVWGFSYATGSPFVTSAMRLREQCQEAISLVDPHGEDPALREMVMIGHSMGGLLAKLQITDSQDRLWNSISKTPLQSIRATPDAKRELEKRLFFTPQPHVKRVIYIATPHQAASIASLGTGRFFSAFVHPDEQVRTFHDRLVHDNPNVFYGTFRKRIPTSIDLLEPSDNTLQSIYDLPVPYNVCQHLIIGTGEGPWNLGLNDGVVPVSSARHRCADTEIQVKASHTKILKHEETISEVIRLLHLHLTEVESQNWP